MATLGVAAWPFAVRAQQRERVRHVAMLLGLATENDQTAQSMIALFRAELAKLGWLEGRNLRLDLRFGAGDLKRMRTVAAELVSLAPDVIVSNGRAATNAAQEATQTIPIVFFGVGDAVANGTVKNVSRPEGNATGVTNRFASLGGKLVELMKEAVTSIERLSLIEQLQLGGSSPAQLEAIREAAHALNITAVQLPYGNIVDLVRRIDAFAAAPNVGVIVLQPAPPFADRETIIRLTTEHRLPSIAGDKAFAREGGLMAYATEPADLYRRAPFYVDRILRGAKPGDLPIEFPTRFELVINLKTAKAIGLKIPESFLLRADELIE